MPYQCSISPFVIKITDPQNAPAVQLHLSARAFMRSVLLIALVLQVEMWIVKVENWSALFIKKKTKICMR